MGNLDNLKYKISNPLTLSEVIHCMNPRDHIAVSYANSKELEEMIMNFFLRGLLRNQLNFWLIKKEEKETWTAILNKNGINVNHLIESQELVILDHYELFSSIPFGSSFNPILAKLEDLKSLIVKKQKSGINAIGTLAGSLFSQTKFSDCKNIERNWHQVIESFEIPITLLCLYQSSMTEKSQSDLIESHNVGLLLSGGNSYTLKQVKEKNEKELLDYTPDSKITKKEFAILKILNEIVPIIQDSNKMQESTYHSKTIPKWYSDLINSLSKLYDMGYGNSFKEKEDLR